MKWLAFLFILFHSLWLPNKLYWKFGTIRAYYASTIHPYQLLTQGQLYWKLGGI